MASLTKFLLTIRGHLRIRPGSFLLLDVTDVRPAPRQSRGVAYTDRHRTEAGRIVDLLQIDAVRVVLRLLAAVPAGYVLTATLVALMGGVLVWLGMPRAEAVSLAAMLGFVVYLLVLLRAFSLHSVAKLWTELAGGTVLALGLLWFVS